MRLFLLWIVGAASTLPTQAARAEDASRTTNPESKQTANDEPPDCLRSLTAPLYALAAVRVQPNDKVGVRDAIMHLYRRLGPKLAVRPFIATIPDPNTSGLVYQYESALQAIRLGFERDVEKGRAGKMNAPEHFFRDRVYLPWNYAASADAAKQSEAHCSRWLPGMMLFRNSRLDQPEVAIVFLVGETPTSGVNAVALGQALDAIKDLGIHEKLPIIGPTFSGSAYSLRVALDAFASKGDAPLGFQIISGTASGADVPRLLRTDSTHRGSPITYQATTVPDAAAECAYMWFLRSRLGVSARHGSSELVGVASLRESGTEFGADPAREGSAPCTLKPELSLSFPTHISMLRDAYEKMDHDQQADREHLLGRSTTLEVSLAQRNETAFESMASARMSGALDLMLRQVLGELSRHDIKHVSIKATDVGDAIFLARKIRDVAPDVRLAFSEPDEILLHPQYRSSLLGSLIVSPYPFLGVSGLASDSTVHGGFTNAGSQGLSNAVLAQRGLPASEMFKYFFQPDGADAAKAKNAAPLLVWVSTIARDSLVPLDVKAPIDCNQTIYGASLTPADNLKSLCSQRIHNSANVATYKNRQQRQQSWEALNWVGQSNLSIHPSQSLPHLWNLLYLILCVGFIIDWTRQNMMRRRLARDKMPKTFSEGGDDRAADRAIGRTSWWLYATIRRFLFVLTFMYMGAVYLLVFSVRVRELARTSHPGHNSSDWWVVLLALLTSLLVLVFLGCAVVSCWNAAMRFRHEFRSFANYVGTTPYPRSLQDIFDGLRSTRHSSQPGAVQPGDTPIAGLIARLSLTLGVAEPLDREQAARVSFAQLRFIALSASVLAIAFAILVTLNVAFNSDAFAAITSSTPPILALSVLRSVSLFSGVSAAAPALSCCLCVYLWCVGRMARLAHAHAMSRVAPGDGEADLVSTPIRLVLYPGADHRRTPDEGYTQAERDLLNAIWRPIVGRTYVAATLAIFVVPVALFSFKPVSTLEEAIGTWLLRAALGLAFVLIGVTWIQLIQYWLRLSRVLGRTLVHELGAAFERLPDFARATLEELLSRSSGDLLRWVACARQLSALIAHVPRSRDDLSPQATDMLRAQGRMLRTDIQHALEMADAPKLGPHESSLALPTPDDAETSQLAERVILVASGIAQLLEHRRAHAIGRARLFGEAPPVAVAVGHDIHEDYELQEVRDVNHATATLNDRACVTPPAPQNQVIVAIAPNTKIGSFRSQSTHSETETMAAHDTDTHAPMESGPIAVLAGSDPASWNDWQAAAEVSVVTVATLLLQQHVRQFRYFMMTLVSMSLMLLLIVISYPFEPYRLLLTYVWLVVGSVVLTGLWIYIQLTRDRLMRHMTQTGAGSLMSTSLGLRVLGWVVVPLLSLAAAQYPDFANLLFKFFVPFAHSLN